MYNENLRPKKSLGQNFLRDENIARKIIAALSLNSGDSVLEIGPGTGMLTKYLAQSGAHVVVVEIDKKLASQLEYDFSDREKITVHMGDFLKTPVDVILNHEKGWKVVANLPYHITSPVLFRIFEYNRFFDQAVLMVQKEVAQRIVAPPNSKTYGILSVLSQYYAEVEKLFDVSPKVFFPVPDVISAVVRWKFKHEQPLTDAEEQVFRIVVKGTFGQRRKMLRNSLRSITALTIDIDQLNFDLEQRPEQLSVSDFIKLTKQIAALQTLEE